MSEVSVTRSLVGVADVEFLFSSGQEQDRDEM